MANPGSVPANSGNSRHGVFHQTFRYADGMVPNLVALMYIFIGYIGGWFLLFSPHFLLFGLGVVILAHSMVLSAYFFHELVHHTIFRASSTNKRMMVLLSWINGACLSHLPRSEKKHLAHHFQKADVISFDFRTWLDKHPSIRRAVILMEWAYIPAVEILMRGSMIAQPFSRSLSHRFRVLGVLIIRMGLWVGVLWWHFEAAIGYVLSSLLFITVLRFIDAFQHTYEPIVASPNEPAPEIPPRDRRYEEDNTYTNLLSYSWPALNLLTLNFVYHNVHHALPAMPWHRLRQYHETHYVQEANPSQILSFHQQLTWYHRYRVARAVSTDYGNVQNGFVGAVGVSFLTVV